MKRIFINGVGCVSPAGWGTGCLRAALAAGTPIPAVELKRPGSHRPLLFRAVPPPQAKGAFLSHPRLRRTSPLTVFAAAAALEALTEAKVAQGRRLGVVFCVTGGCVQFTRRFYDESWRNPGTASPLIFPETVFNAPASHLSALLETPAVNYTYVGDPGAVLLGVATAADWLLDGRVDECLVIGAEEGDWLTSDAYRHFSRGTICSEGAGALLLSRKPGGVELGAITDAKLYLTHSEKERALAEIRSTWPADAGTSLLCDSRTGNETRDRAESAAWSDWKGPTLAPKKILGEGLGAGAAWQCVAAVDRLRQDGPEAAIVSVAGLHSLAVAAQFIRALA